jgi:hypothetical protein
MFIKISNYPAQLDNNKKKSDEKVLGSKFLKYYYEE